MTKRRKFPAILLPDGSKSPGLECYVSRAGYFGQLPPPQIYRTYTRPHRYFRLPKTDADTWILEPITYAEARKEKTLHDREHKAWKQRREYRKREMLALIKAM